jgi:hypothetical protein
MKTKKNTLIFKVDSQGVPTERINLDKYRDLGISIPVKFNSYGKDMTYKMAESLVDYLARRLDSIGCHDLSVELKNNTALISVDVSNLYSKYNKYRSGMTEYNRGVFDKIIESIDGLEFSQGSINDYIRYYNSHIAVYFSILYLSLVSEDVLRVAVSGNINIVSYGTRIYYYVDGVRTEIVEFRSRECMIEFWNDVIKTSPRAIVDYHPRASNSSPGLLRELALSELKLISKNKGLTIFNKSLIRDNGIEYKSMSLAKFELSIAHSNKRCNHKISIPNSHIFQFNEYVECSCSFLNMSSTPSDSCSTHKFDSITEAEKFVKSLVPDIVIIRNSIDEG